MGLRLFVLFVLFGSTNIAYAEGVVNVFDMPVPAPIADVAPEPNVDAPSVVRVFSQLDSAPTESQQAGYNSSANLPVGAESQVPVPLESVDINRIPALQ